MLAKTQYFTSSDTEFACRYILVNTQGVLQTYLAQKKKEERLPGEIVSDKATRCTVLIMYILFFVIIYPIVYKKVLIYQSQNISKLL